MRFTSLTQDIRVLQILYKTFKLKIPPMKNTLICFLMVGNGGSWQHPATDGLLTTKIFVAKNKQSGQNVATRPSWRIWVEIKKLLSRVSSLVSPTSSRLRRLMFFCSYAVLRLAPGKTAGFFVYYIQLFECWWHVSTALTTGPSSLLPDHRLTVTVTFAMTYLTVWSHEYDQIL